MIVCEGIWDICWSVDIVPISVALNNQLNKETAMVASILLCSSIVCNFLTSISCFDGTLSAAFCTLPSFYRQTLLFRWCLGFLFEWWAWKCFSGVNISPKKALRSIICASSNLFSLTVALFLLFFSREIKSPKCRMCNPNLSIMRSNALYCQSSACQEILQAWHYHQTCPWIAF